MRDDAVLRAVLSDDRAEPFTLPRELLTTDRVLQRWAVSVGYGLPLDEWDDQPRPKPPPLPDDVAIVVDRCVVKSPPRTRELVTRWYKTPQPVDVLARKLGISQRNVYRAHGICLEFMRWRFENTGHPELLRLIRRIEA